MSILKDFTCIYSQSASMTSVCIAVILLQNVSPAILSRLRLWKHSRNAIPQQRGCTSPVSSALLIVRRAVQHRVQVSQLRADEPLSSRNVPSISKSHRAVLDRKVGERYVTFLRCYKYLNEIAIRWHVLKKKKEN